MSIVCLSRSSVEYRHCTLAATNQASMNQSNLSHELLPLCQHILEAAGDDPSQFRAYQALLVALRPDVELSNSELHLFDGQLGPSLIDSLKSLNPQSGSSLLSQLIYRYINANHSLYHSFTSRCHCGQSVRGRIRATTAQTRQNLPISNQEQNHVETVKVRQHA